MALGIGGGGGTEGGARRKLLKGLICSSHLDLLIFTQMYAHVKIHQTVRFKYMQLIIGLLNMDKAGFLFFVFFKENPGTGDTGR